MLVHMTLHMNSLKTLMNRWRTNIHFEQFACLFRAIRSNLIQAIPLFGAALLQINQLCDELHLLTLFIPENKWVVICVWVVIILCRYHTYLLLLLWYIWMHSIADKELNKLRLVSNCWMLYSIIELASAITRYKNELWCGRKCLELSELEFALQLTNAQAEKVISRFFS